MAEPKPPPALVQLPPVEPAHAVAPIAPAGARPVAYACLTDNLCQDEPGVCPVCKKPFTAVAIANPDPAVCPVTGDPVRSTKSAVIGGKVYFFCCGDCIEIMQRDPAKVLEAAEQRAKAKP